MSILPRKMTITVSAGTSLIVQLGWNASSMMFSLSWGTVDSSIEKHYHGRVLRHLDDFVFTTWFWHTCTRGREGCETLTEGSNPALLQAQHFHPDGCQCIGILRHHAYRVGYQKHPKHPAANYLCCSSQACKYMPGHSRNMRCGDDQWRDCVNKYECTYGFLLPISIHRSVGADLLLTYNELPLGKTLSFIC